MGREYNYYCQKRSSAVLVLTWACTSRCATCTAWRRPRDRARELTSKEWLGVGRTLARQGIRSAELFGGDIFLRKDVLIPLCQLLASYGCKVHIPTNSNLMDEQTARQLTDSVYTFYLSTDGTEEMHDRLRGSPGTFGRVKNALELIRQARGSRPYPRLVCNTTVSRHNFYKLQEIAEFASKAGYDEIAFEYVGQFTNGHIAGSRIGRYTPSPIYLLDGRSVLVPPTGVHTLRRQLQLAKRLGDASASPGPGFRVVTGSIDALSDTDLVRGTVPGSRCFFERNTMSVDPYGNIIPCLFFDTFPLGNVREGALAQSLNTPDRLLFRRLRDNGQLELCRHCIMAVVRNRTGRYVMRRAYAEARARNMRD